jgi:hypothetical protein
MAAATASSFPSAERAVLYEVIDIVCLERLNQARR